MGRQASEIAGMIGKFRKKQDLKLFLMNHNKLILNKFLLEILK
jgi:hypothetical protein